MAIQCLIASDLREIGIVSARNSPGIPPEYRADTLGRRNLLASLRNSTAPNHPELMEETLKNLVFIDLLPWFVGYFALCPALLLCCRP